MPASPEHSNPIDSGAPALVTPAAHQAWMREALQQARLAADVGEVPVGAVVVSDGRIIARAHNRTRELDDPTAHAELLALRAAAAALGNHRLDACTLYVTLEPCAMCSGAVFQARLKAVVFAAAEPKTGAGGSVVNLFDNRVLNHHTVLVGGVLAQESASLLAAFFQRRRGEQAASRQPLPDFALRTPQACFSACPPAGQYTAALPGAAGMRVHYQQLDGRAGPLMAPPRAWLLLHPLWHWSAWWQPLLDRLAQQTAFALAPDLPGWGRSDKPKHAQWHDVARHAQVLAELLQAVRAPRVTVVAGDGTGGIAHALASLVPDRVAQTVVAPVVADALWPAPPGWLRSKPWALASQVAQAVRERPGADGLRALADVGTVLDQACAPYPDAGHARSWLASQLAAGAAAVAEAPAGVARHAGTAAAATARGKVYTVLDVHAGAAAWSDPAQFLARLERLLPSSS